MRKAFRNFQVSIIKMCYNNNVMENKGKNCSCGIEEDYSEERIDIRDRTDCPYCGTRFPDSSELFKHVFVFHSL